MILKLYNRLSMIPPRFLSKLNQLLKFRKLSKIGLRCLYNQISKWMIRIIKASKIIFCKTKTNQSKLMAHKIIKYCKESKNNPINKKCRSIDSL